MMNVKSPLKPLTRRKLLCAGSSALLASLVPATKSIAQMQLGEMRITSLADGALRLPASMVMAPFPLARREQLIIDFALGEVLTPPCNVTLLQIGGRNILCDVGAGPEFMTSAGYLIDALDEVGLAPEDITDVIFTHAHPDHLWGLVDDFDDLLFSNATYKIGQVEWDYWTNPETVETIGDERTTFAVGAARRLARIADQIEFFKDGDEIMSGVMARATFGHTPGHMAFEVRQGTEALMILGDSIGNAHAALAFPDLKSGSDQDQDLGATTRTALLDHVATDQMQVLGYHLPGNGVGHIEREGGAYRFVPTA